MFDEQCKEQALSDDERLAVHQRDSAPVMAELQRWLRAELDEKRVEPNSGLGEAFEYLLKPKPSRIGAARTQTNLPESNQQSGLKRKPSVSHSVP